MSSASTLVDSISHETDGLEKSSAGADVESGWCEEGFQDAEQTPNNSSHHLSNMRRTDSNVNLYLRKVSSTLHEDEKTKFYDIESERLRSAMRDAVDYSIGVSAAIVWEFNVGSSSTTGPTTTDGDNSSKSNNNNNGGCGTLTSPSGGWWRHPTFVPDDRDALNRLENPHHPQYVPPAPTIPGVDISGVLWERSTTSTSHDQHAAAFGSKGRVSSTESLARILRRSIVDDAGRNKDDNDENAGGHLRHSKRNEMVWRDLRSLERDPDTPKSPRLQCLIQAGFGQAAAVTHVMWGHKIMVIYFARSTTIHRMLTSLPNQEHMVRSANVISAILAASYARRACIANQNEIRRCAWIKFKHGLLKLKGRRDLAASIEFEETTDKKESERILRDIRWEKDISSWSWTAWITSYVQKFQGGSLQVPPALSWHQCLYTWIGCFFGLLVLSAYNEGVIHLSDGEYELLLGPFGALMTLQYALTSAPASQPRNVVMGQAISGGVCMILTYIPDWIISKWVRRAFAPAFGITAMTALGVPHPPAGAHSVIYSSGNYGWVFYFLVVLASAISIFPAIIINNISDKRQYPIYWTKYKCVKEERKDAK